MTKSSWSGSSWVALFFILLITPNVSSSNILLNDKPVSQITDLSLLFNVAMTAAEDGKTSIAIALLRQMLSVDPILHRPRLELARLLHFHGDYEAAKTHFEYVLAADIPEEVRANIQQFLTAMRINVKPSFYASFEVVQDTNPISSSDEDYVQIGSNLFRLNPDNKPDTETGYAFYGGARFPIDELGKWAFNLQLEHREFSGSDMDYSYVFPNMTKGFELGKGNAMTFTVGRHFSGYGGESLFKGNVYKLDHKYQIKPNLFLNSNVSVMNLNYYDMDNRDSDYKSISTTFTYNLNSTKQMQLGFDYLNADAKNNMYSYDKPLVQATMSGYWKGGFITNLRLSKSWFDYENEDLFFGDKRNDREEQVELTIMNQRLNFKGIAPKLHIGKIKHKSNLNYYAYDRSYGKVSFSRNF
jgi:hypothetical protein